MGRGLAVGVAGVLVHELQGGGEGAFDGVDGFRARPEPGGVDVGVAGEVDGGLGEDGVGIPGDELERTAFNELMNDLRAEDRAAARGPGQPQGPVRRRAAESGRACC